MEIENTSSPNFWSVSQPGHTQQTQEEVGPNYHQNFNINFPFMGDSSKIFPSLTKLTDLRCRDRTESFLTRASTESNQESSKKEKSQAFFFGNGGSENADIFNDFASPDSTIETQNSHVPSEFSVNFDSPQIREEASDAILFHVDDLSTESRQNAARNLPGLVVGRAKRDCKAYFRIIKKNIKTKKQDMPEYLSYVKDIIESNDFTCYTEGLLEKHMKELRLTENTYKGVFQVFQSTSPACRKLLFRVTQTLLSENGRTGFSKWFNETKMDRATKTALHVKKACLLANFNEKFAGRYDF